MAFKEIKNMVFAETLMNFTDRKTNLTLNTDASDKQLDDRFHINSSTNYT